MERPPGPDLGRPVTAAGTRWWQYNAQRSRWEFGTDVNGEWKSNGYVTTHAVEHTDRELMRTAVERQFGIPLPDDAWPYTTDGDPDGRLIEDVAAMLYQIQVNYEREGTCTPGGRFYGQRLEVVQARAVIRHLRHADTYHQEGKRDEVA